MKVVKNLVAMILVAVSFLPVSYTIGNRKPATPEHNLYTMNAMVFELEEENDLVVIEDFYGNLWDFGGIDNWAVGDICSVVMDDMGTENIFDDEIILVSYES